MAGLLQDLTEGGMGCESLRTPSGMWFSQFHQAKEPPLSGACHSFTKTGLLIHHSCCYHIISCILLIQHALLSAQRAGRKNGGQYSSNLGAAQFLWLNQNLHQNSTLCVWFPTTAVPSFGTHCTGGSSNLENF